MGLDETRLEEKRKEILARGFSYEQLVDQMAMAEVIIEGVPRLFSMQKEALEEAKEKSLVLLRKTKKAIDSRSLEMMNSAKSLAEDTLNIGAVVGAKVYRKAKAKHAANEGHNRPGGYRDKKRVAIELWLSGKYQTKRECAKQNCGKVGVSCDTMVGYLNRAPAPNPWPARDKARKKK